MNKFKPEKILSENFIKLLHRKMFRDVWLWAGEFRRSDKNIGTSWFNIVAELKYLLDDAIYWIENETYPPDETAIRFNPT